jgi:hypothetical protein
MTELEQLLQQAEATFKALMDKDERERKFALESRQLFKNNIQAFEKYYPDIAKTIHEYTPDVDFEILVTSSGHGNFVPKAVGIPIYSDDPLQQTRKQLDKNTTKGYYSLTQYGFGVSSQDMRIHSRYMARLDNEIKALRDQAPEPLGSLPAHFPTALLFGVGLGYVVTLLLEKHTFDYMFITEPDLEIFYASLYCTDWAAIIDQVDKAGNTLFLQIGLDISEFFAAVYQVSMDIGAYSLIRAFCYQHYPSVKVNEQIAEFFNRYYEIQAGYGFYNDAITGLSHCLMNYKSKASFFTLPSVRKYIDMPVAVVGNGPSLDAAADALRKIQDEVIIFAAGTALGSLAKHGIKADFHVLVERPKSTYDVLLDSFDPEYYADLNLLAVDVMYPDVVELYKWAGLALKGPEASTVFTQVMLSEDERKFVPSLPFSGPLVANTALSYAMSIGFREIYLFGVDNGYLNGKTHSENSIYASNDNYNKIIDKGAVYKLKGNLTQDVMATNLLKLAHKFMESLIKMDKKSFIYNIGEGAFIEGALPLKEEDIFLAKNSLKKNDVVAQIKEKFFIRHNFNVTPERLAFTQFDELCDHLNAIASEPFTTRQQASDLLKRQARYVYAFRGSRYVHLFHIIKGSLLYFHSPMLTVLYQYQDETLSLECFEKLLQIWRSYVEEMKQDYRMSWNKKCDWGMDMEFLTAG